MRRKKRNSWRAFLLYHLLKCCCRLISRLMFIREISGWLLMKSVMRNFHSTIKSWPIYHVSRKKNSLSLTWKWAWHLKLNHLVWASERANEQTTDRFIENRKKRMNEMLFVCLCVCVTICAKFQWDLFNFAANRCEWRGWQSFDFIVRLLVARRTKKNLRWPVYIFFLSFG